MRSGGSSVAQDASKTAQNCPKRPSRRAKTAPRRSQEGSMEAQDGPRGAQEGLKRAPRRAPTGLQEGTRNQLGRGPPPGPSRDPPGTLPGPSRDPPGPLRGAMSTLISANDSATNFHQLDAPQEAGIVRKGMFITCPQSVFQGGGLRQFGKAKPPPLDSYTCRARVCPSHP